MCNFTLITITPPTPTINRYYHEEVSYICTQLDWHSTCEFFIAKLYPQPETAHSYTAPSRGMGKRRRDVNYTPKKK
jgi:hypothetical protein